MRGERYDASGQGKGNAMSLVYSVCTSEQTAQGQTTAGCAGHRPLCRLETVTTIVVNISIVIMLQNIFNVIQPCACLSLTPLVNNINLLGRDIIVLRAS